MWVQLEANECVNNTAYLGYCVLDLFSSNVHSLYLGCVGRNFKKRPTWCSLQWPIPHMAQTDVDGHAHEVAAIRKKEEMDKGETEYHICSCCKFFYYNGWFCHLAVSAISHVRVCASAVTSILHYMSLVVWSTSRAKVCLTSSKYTLSTCGTKLSQIVDFHYCYHFHFHKTFGSLVLYHTHPLCIFTNKVIGLLTSADEA